MATIRGANRAARRQRVNQSSKGRRTLTRAGAALVAVPAAGAGLGLIAVLPMGSAGAVSSVGDSTCPHGGNYFFSDACTYGQVNYGVASTINNAGMSTTTANGFKVPIFDGLLDYSGSPCSAEMQVGTEIGWNNSNYSYYTAWSGNGSSAVYVLGGAAADNSSHNYEVLYGGGSNFQSYIDGNLKASVNGFGGGGCIGAAGLETAGFGFGIQTNTFNHTPLKYEDTSGNWHQGWSTSKYWIDYPCNNGQSPPNCLNGVFPGNSNNEWSDNQPA